MTGKKPESGISNMDSPFERAAEEALRCGHRYPGGTVCGCYEFSPNHAFGGYLTHPFSPGPTRRSPE